MSLYSAEVVIRSSTEKIVLFMPIETWQNHIWDNIDTKGRTSLVLSLSNSAHITGQIDRVRQNGTLAQGRDQDFWKEGSCV